MHAGMKQARNELLLVQKETFVRRRLKCGTAVAHTDRLIVSRTSQHDPRDERAEAGQRDET